MSPSFPPEQPDPQTPAADSKKHRALTALLLALLPLVYFYPAVIGKVTLAPGDGWSQIFGIRVLIGQMLRQGLLPLWNPYLFGGMPLLAAIQPGALYPPSWLFAVFSPQTAMNLMVLLTYHVAITGAYLYARRIGLDRLSALITGTTFTFGGFMLAHMGHTNRIAAAAWLPWVMLVLEQLYRNTTWRWISAGAVIIALQILAGEPQMTCYIALLAGAYFLFSLRRREELERRWRFFGGVAAMGLCGALLSAIQLLPARELLQQGERAGITYEYFSQFALAPEAVFALIFPYFFGGAAMAPYRVEYWGQWGVAEMSGYVGLLGLALTFVALTGRRKQQATLTWFWAIAAVVALLLAFGANLPFELNRLLHRVPVYNLFRAAGRHRLEFTFALAVLAGLGVHYLRHSARADIRRAVWSSTLILSSLVTITLIVYRFFSASLPAGRPRMIRADALTNAEALIPLACFALCLTALWVFSKFKTPLAGAFLLVVLLVDLASFGHFFEWKLQNFPMKETLADPPAVSVIKAREKELNSFRIFSHSALPFGSRYRELNYPNVSILRGLQTVNGYDPVRLLRMADIAGEMTLDGLTPDLSVLGNAHQGFNLLNVKYLLRERRDQLFDDESLVISDVRFNKAPLNVRLRPGAKAALAAAGTAATELICVSTMGNAPGLTQGTPVVRIRIRTKDGQVIEREMQAGRDTAEWAYDRADVRAAIKHNRPPVAETWPADGFEGHSFVARFSFDRAEIEGVEFESLLPETPGTAAIETSITRASLFDKETENSTPLDLITIPAERWRKLDSFGKIDLYENLNAAPRAWFVRRLETLTHAEVLRTIKEGKTPNGASFNPQETALLEIEDFGGKKIELPPVADPAGAEVRVTRYEPHRIEIETRNSQPGFLVLSEIYYRGWDARIDGQKAPVYRPDYALRGLAVPPGNHRIEFVFRAPSFRTGAIWTFVGMLLLLAGAIVNATRPPRFFSMLERSGESLTRAITTRSFLLKSMSGVLLYLALLLGNTAHTIGGSDSSSYANTAQSFLKEKLVQPVTLLEKLGLSDEYANFFIPLGYLHGPRPATMSPLVTSGMPLHIAGAAWLAGWKRGPGIVSPLAALFSVILMYLLARELGLSRNYGISGAIILAVCPFFLFIALQPMSDVLATLWAMLAIYAALRSQQRLWWSVIAGAAFGVSFLVRPSNVLMLVPLCFCLPLRPRHLLSFIAGGVPLSLIFFLYNYTAYGHPLQTGYVATGHTLATSGFIVRFNHYVYWLLVTLSPLVLLGWLGVARNRALPGRARGMLLGWFGAFFLFYCCYPTYDAWWYTRFLLPGTPALILGALLTAQWIFQSRIETDAIESNQWNWRRVAGAAAFALILLCELVTIARYDVISIKKSESIYPTACQWADPQLPREALILASQMSGALKYYTGRPSVRHDWLDASHWQTVKNRAAEKKLPWFALLMDWEVATAQKNIPARWKKLGDLRHVSLWQIEPEP